MSDDHKPDAPKLIIDSDWKNQAQAEKDRLNAKAAAKPAAPAKGAGPATSPLGIGPGVDGPEGEELPPADFQALLGTMVTQALMYMGAFPDPETGRAMVSPDHARLHIDLLAVLQDKTKGNLSAEEGEALAQVIGELRMRFVELNQAVAKMMAERAARGPGAVGMSPGMGPGAGPGMGPGMGLGMGPGTGPAGPKLTF